MRSIRGVAASKGIAIGKLCIRQPYAQTEHLLSSEDAQVEIQRLDAARIAAEQKHSPALSSGVSEIWGRRLLNL